MNENAMELELLMSEFEAALNASFSNALRRGEALRKKAWEVFTENDEFAAFVFAFRKGYGSAPDADWGANDAAINAAWREYQAQKKAAKEAKKKEPKI